MDRKILFTTAGIVAVAVLVVLLALRNNGLKPSNTDDTHIYDVGIAASEIPALTNPTFTTIAAMDNILADDVYGIDVEVAGVHKFYPDQILNWHQVVNEPGILDGGTLVVVHDPLSGVSAAFNTDMTFHATGKVLNNTMLMQNNKTLSLWLASTGVAIDEMQVGGVLTRYPSQSMPWSAWKKMYPNGDVLSNETGFSRDYTRHPYGDYENAKTLLFPIEVSDDRLQAKTVVDTVAIENDRLAISRGLMMAAMVVNDTVGGTPIVAMYSEETKSTNVFVVPESGDPSALTFKFDKESGNIIDNETGSVWNANGRAVSGKLRDAQLEVLNAPEMYWFAWVSAYPETRVNPDATILNTAANE